MLSTGTSTGEAHAVSDCRQAPTTVPVRSPPAGAVTVPLMLPPVPGGVVGGVTGGVTGGVVGGVMGGVVGGVVGGVTGGVVGGVVGGRLLVGHPVSMKTKASSGAVKNRFM